MGADRGGATFSPVFVPALPANSYHSSVSALMVACHIPRAVATIRSAMTVIPPARRDVLLWILLQAADGLSRQAGPDRLVATGEVSERLKEHAWKVCMG